MKRLLSLILVLALVLSLGILVGCKKEEAAAETPAAGATDTTTPPAGDAGLTNIETGEASTGAAEATDDIDLTKTKPNEYVQAKLDAGMEVQLGWTSPTLQDEFMILISDGLKGQMEEYGFTLSYASPEYDNAKQVEIVENYMQMGCAAIALIPMDATAYIDLINQGLENGTYICFLGTIPDFNVPGAANVDVIDSANACYEMACAWIDTGAVGLGADGKIHAAVLGQCNNIDNKKRSEQLKANVENDERMVLSYYVDKSNSIDEGYNDAEASLTYDPEIRVFLNFSTASSVGVSNYVLGQAKFAAAKDEFGVFTMGNNTTLSEMIDQAAEGGESVCRGTIEQGGDVPWGGIRDVMLGLLLEGKEMPYIIREHMWSYCHIEGYSYDNQL